MNFVSSIKVKGLHLLPPVISERRRTEIEKYKQQAIQIEKRVKHSTELKKNLEELFNLQPLPDCTHSGIFRNEFQQDSGNEACQQKFGNSSEKSKPSEETKYFRKVTLKTDIVDVTEYNDDGIKIIHDDSITNYPELYQGCQLNCNNRSGCNINTSFHKLNDAVFPVQLRNNHFSKPSADLSDCQLLDLQTENDSTDSVFEYITPKNSTSLKYISPQRSPKPKLIRSNSYTLESPSPILLAHLEKNKHCEMYNIEQFKHVSSSRNWSSMENNYVPFEDGEYSSINTVCNNSDNKAASNDRTSSNTVSSTVDKSIVEKCKSPSVEIIQTDISLQQITVNSNSQLDNVSNEGMEKTCLSDIDLRPEYVDADAQLMCLLKNIPEDYSKKIIELIQLQRQEQYKRANNVEIIKNHLLNDSVNLNSFNTSVVTQNFDNTRNVTNNNNENPQDDNLILESNKTANKDESISYSLKKPNLCNSNRIVNIQDLKQNNLQHTLSSESDKLINSALSLSPSQSLYYSITSSELVQPSRSPSLIVTDLEYRDFLTSEEHNFLEKSSKNIIDIYSQNDSKSIKRNSSRELFPDINAAPMQNIKKDWAAAVIGAHVKGYLTRRLLKTERVQALIDTIKDALMCALQLHNAENIEESDIELHRRLINQVSAACYAFHDIFFSLPIQEQMLMIAVDRQRKIEKAKRPVSAPASHRSRSSSSRSSSRQKFNNSRSLTKV